MCRSRIADEGIRVAKSTAVENRGAILLRTTDETDSGVGAEGENEVSCFFGVSFVAAICG